MYTLRITRVMPGVRCSWRMQHMWRKRTKRVQLLTALPIVLAFTLAATLIVADGLTDDIHVRDVAIVLG